MSGRYPDPVGKGSLERVEQKRSEKSPDFKGRITIEGKEYWLSGWDRDGRNGPFISLSVEPKLARDYPGASRNPPAQHATNGNTTTGRNAPAQAEADFDDDIPF